MALDTTQIQDKLVATFGESVFNFTQEKSIFSLEVASDKMDAYMQADPSMMNNFTQSAFQNADEGDAEMIADMMQQTSGKNSAYLMSSMMENNDTMITSVYGNLAEQNFDKTKYLGKWYEIARLDFKFDSKSGSFDPSCKRFP